MRAPLLFEIGSEAAPRVAFKGAGACSLFFATLVLATLKRLYSTVFRSEPLSDGLLRVLM